MTKKARRVPIGIGALLISALVVACSASAGEQRASESIASSTATAPSATPGGTTPAPSPTTPELVAGTCATTSTVGFQAMAAANGWVPEERQDQPDGGNPFELFPGGSPGGAVSCSWAQAEGGTDNAVFLAWAPIEPDAASAAQQMLVGEGAQRIDTSAGVYIWFPGQGGGESPYLFTNKDVRWSLYAPDLGYIKAPEENG